MKVIVAVKRVLDYALRPRVDPNRISGVQLTNVKMSMNPFCEIAVEEAVRLKEDKTSPVKDIIAVSIGPKQCSETLRTALAMGCDRGVHIQTDLRTDYMELQSDTVAKLLREMVKKEEEDDGNVGMVLVGKQAIDSDCGQVGPYLAGLMNWPSVTFAANVEMKDGGVVVERETDNGTESILIPKLPAVISCDLRLNEPRYATLPNIMKAKKKKVEIIKADEMGVNLAPKNVIIEVYEPPPRKEGIIVADVHELVDKLRNEAKVIS